MMRGLDDDSHVKTRVSQYEALNNGKGYEIAKQLVASKIRGQNILLTKHSLKLRIIAFKEKIEVLETVDLESFRKRITGLEGKFRRGTMSKYSG